MDRSLPVVTTLTETAALRVLHPSHRGTKAVARAASAASERGAAWVCVTGVLSASTRTRRAGTEGLAAWAAASAVSFGIKRAVSRPRPRLVPRIGPGASSSSMPSSHTAGAVAYATAATLAAPLLGPALAPAAALVAWSRTVTARHFPTDVAVGALVGAAVGAALHVAARRRPALQTVADEARPEGRRAA